MKEIAQGLIDKGVRIWPLGRGGKRPTRGGFAAKDGPKACAEAHEFNDRTDIAVLTGPLVCVDFDGGAERGDCPITLPPTLEYKTRKGYHAWYLDTSGTVRAQCPWWTGEGKARIDVKAGLGGYARITVDGTPLVDFDPALIAELPAGDWPRVGAERPAPSALPIEGNRGAPTDRMRDSFISRFVRDPSASNRLAGALGGWLAGQGWTPEAAEALFEAWLAGGDAKVKKHAEDARRAAETARTGGRVPGAGVLRELGVVVESTVDRPPPGTLGCEILDAAAVAYARLPPIAWVSEAYGICPGAPTVLAGHAGAGKTYLAQDLALAVATPGREWLGTPVRHGSVLHIDHEQGHRETIGRYQDLGIEEHADLDVAVLPLWRMSLDEGLGTLRTLSQDRTLVLVDSLRASLPGEDENDSDLRKYLDALSAVSSDTGCTFMLIHHAKKGSADARGNIDTVRGTSGIVDAAATVITLTVPPYEDTETRPPPIMRLVKARTWGPRLDWTPKVVSLGRAKDGTSAITAADVKSAGDRIRADVDHILDHLGEADACKRTLASFTRDVQGKASLVRECVKESFTSRGWRPSWETGTS